MSGYRITYEEELIGIKPRRRRPRIEREAHLAFIRSLPCVICGSRPVEPAHLRTASPIPGKRAGGAEEKPNDRFVTPLCRQHHDEQHGMMTGVLWWRRYRIDNPRHLALALYAASTMNDAEAAEQIILEHRQVTGEPR
jgi:hypothetical protein